MYVRWQSRKRRRAAYGSGSGPDVHWSAILVEALRVKGKPVQQYIAYLGGITESAIAIVHQRCWFWEHVGECLDRLRNRISAADRQQIEQVVAKRVPRPTKAQYAKCVRDRARWFGES
jgi:hypothetical protein